MREDEAHHVAVGDVTVHGHDPHLSPLGAAVKPREGPDGRGVPAGGDVEDHAPLGVGEHRRIHEGLAHSALVDREVATEAPAAPRGGASTPLADGQAQVVGGDTEIPRHRRGGAAPGEIGEEPQRPFGGASPPDPLEAFVEGALGTVGVLADEATHAKG